MIEKRLEKQKRKIVGRPCRMFAMKENDRDRVRERCGKTEGKGRKKERGRGEKKREKKRDFEGQRRERKSLKDKEI